MRVLLISYEYPPIGGGAATAFAALLRELQGQQDVHLDVITTHPADYDKYEWFEWRGEGFCHTMTSLPIRKDCRHYWTAGEVAQWIWRSRRSANAHLGDQHYDVVHLWSGFPMPRLRWPVPLVISLLGSDVPGFNERLDRWWYPPLIRYQWERAFRVVANSEELLLLARRTWEGRIDIIPTGVDLSAFTPPETPPPPNRWLTCGRLIPRKQIDRIIKACSIPGCTLTIAGEGPERAKIEASIPPNVVCVGRVDPWAMPALYREHGIYVHASRHEGLSNCVLEAQASGMPVVDLTQSGAATQLRQLMDCRESYLGARQSARERSQGYSWSATARAYVDLYMEASR